MTRGLTRRQAMGTAVGALTASGIALPQDRPKRQSFPGSPAFRRRCFYLHAGWLFNHPFSVRRWTRGDFAGMFRLLGRFGYDRVMLWPMMESLPPPLSAADRDALSQYRHIVADAQGAGLECWVVSSPCLTSEAKIADRPWMERNPYRFARTLRMDRPSERAMSLAHRRDLIRTLNNADAYVTIDGDPGGYPGATPADFLALFNADRAAIDEFGTHPKQQKVMPWIWCGWGTRGVWQEPGGPEGIVPFVRPTLELLAKEMRGPSEFLIGRSNPERSANGRVNIDLAEKLNLLERSSLLCYEAVEFEPTPPASVIQFADIRRILNCERKYAATAVGVAANAQQPLMTLPNMYLFGRSSWDLNYLSAPDSQVYRDLAELLGGPSDVLAAAWTMHDAAKVDPALPARIRAARLGPTADDLPGGPKVYLEILARQAETVIEVATAIERPGDSIEDAAERTAKATAAIVGWWRFSGYVGDGGPETPFQWHFVHQRFRTAFGSWVHRLADKAAAAKLAAEKLAARKVLPMDQARARMRDAFGA